MDGLGATISEHSATIEKQLSQLVSLRSNLSVKVYLPARLPDRLPVGLCARTSSGLISLIVACKCGGGAYAIDVRRFDGQA